MRKTALFLAVLMLSGCAASPSGPTLDFESVDLLAATDAGSEGSQNEQPVQSEPEDEEARRESALDRFAEIEIEDQSGDGSSVLIDEIQISAGNAFLVIYDSSGMVLGSTLVTPQSQPVRLRLDMPIATSQELEAALYLDDGDGKLSINDDIPIYDDERELVHEDFYYAVNVDD